MDDLEFSIERLIRRHVIPVGGCLVLTLLLLPIVLWLFPTGFYWGVPACLFLTSLMIGWMAPKEDVDYRGSNGTAVLLMVWLWFFVFAAKLLPEARNMSDWFVWTMGSCIAQGVAILSGAFLGTYLQYYYDINAKITTYGKAFIGDYNPWRGSKK